MTIKKTDTPLDYVATDAAMSGLLEAMEAVQTVAIDTEADSFHHFHHKVCLIQLAIDGRCFVVDPLAGLDLSKMLSLLSQKRLIFHDAGYDLRMMLSSFGFLPQNDIFDTMLAARLSGLENISLSALLEEILGIRLAKQNQRADWSQRPLAAEKLAYAVEDIRHLTYLADYLTKRLESLGRMEWHRQYCRWVIGQTQIAKEPDDLERVWRIRGTHGLPPRQLAFVRALWQWRQNQADRADLSPFRIMGNEPLVHLALWAEQQEKINFDKLPRLPQHCKGNRLRLLIEALKTAEQLSPDQWPKPLRNSRGSKPDTNVLKKVDRLKTACQKIADSLALPPQLIASQKNMMAAVNTQADTEEKLLRIGWMRWQADLLIEPLQAILGTPSGAVQKEASHEDRDI